MHQLNGVAATPRDFYGSSVGKAPGGEQGPPSQLLLGAVISGPALPAVLLMGHL